MKISSATLRRFHLIPRIKLSKTLYRLANNYNIELEDIGGKTRYEMYWENWGRKIRFSQGEFNNEDDFIYHVEYAAKCAGA
jgi:hypothetical protein